MFDLSVRGGSLAFKKIKAFVITVGTPLYKFIVKIATIVGDGIAKVLEGVREVFAAIVKVIGNIFQGIAALVVGLGMGYLGILAKTMRFFLKFGRLGDLIFTPIALAYLALPLILSYMFYWKGIVIVPASILTIILYIRGYAVLKSAQ